MTKAPDRLGIHQALHGYANGHRMLKSSLSLSRDSLAQLLILSDLSGPIPSESFESYLTGFPLPADGVFVLARTWLAHEMPRPGTVWTHSLLIPFGGLGAFVDLSTLDRLFARLRSTARSGYDYPVDVKFEAPNLNPTADPGWKTPGPEFQTVYQALYPRLAVDLKPVITSLDSDHGLLESFVYSVWSQQWPSLRETFSFCTGAFSIRRDANKVPLSLQFVPNSQLNRVRRTEPRERIIVIDSKHANTPKEDWLLLSIDNLGMGGSDAFKQHLWNYAADAPSNRSSLRRLAEALDLIARQGDSLSGGMAVAEVLSEHFPSPTEALRIKLAALGPPNIRGLEGISHLSEVDTLHSLIAEGNSQAFDPIKFDIQERTRTLVASDPATAYELAKHISVAPETQASQASLAGLSHAVAPEIFAKFALHFPGLINPIISINPDLAKSPQVWNIPEQCKEELFRTVFGLDLTMSDLKAIMHAAIFRRHPM